MKFNSNTAPAESAYRKRGSFDAILNVFSAMKAMFDSDLFLRCANVHNEKLPIIYANIRV